MHEVQKWDDIILLAKNEEGDVVTACRWGVNWYYVYENKNDPILSGRTGDTHNTKSSLLDHAYNYIINESGLPFISSDLQCVVKNQAPIFMSTDQKIAINTAYNLLFNSNSDHADQCCFYLKQLMDNMNK